MSYDDSDSSLGSPPAGETAPHIANAALRIAVTSRSTDATQTIWNEVRRRIAKSGEFLALPSQGTDAGAAIFHLTAEDLATEDAARNFAAAMFQSAAPLNFLVRSFFESVDEARQRLDGIAGEMKKRAGFLEVPLPKEAPDVQGGNYVLLFQARGVANYLLNDPPPLCSVALSEFASHEKAARQDAKAAKKNSKRASKTEEASPGQRANKSDREKSPKKNRKAEGVAPEAVASDSEKAAKKAGKTSKKAKRRSAKETGAKPDEAAPSVVANASQDKQKDRSEKKAAKAAAKAARVAERKNRKAENKASTAAEPADSATRNKAEKKAAKAAKRESRKAEKRAKPGTQAAKSEKKDKPADKAQRKARKAAAAETEPGLAADEDASRKKRKKKDKPAGEAEKLERKSAKAAKKEERKSAKGDKKEKRGKRRGDGGSEGDNASRPLSIALSGMDERAAASVREAMDRYLNGVPADWSSSQNKVDIAVYAFDNPPVAEGEIAAQASSIAQGNPKVRIFLERSSAGGQDGAARFSAENRAIAFLAGSFKSPLIKMDTKIGRYGADTAPVGDIIASSILGIAAGRLSKRKVPRPAVPPPPDLVAARALAATPQEFLSQLSWKEDKAPRLLWTHASKESAEAFMDRKIALSEEQTLDITVPIAWPEDASGRSSIGDAFGLEFLSGPLNYWYSKANGRDSRKVADVDAVLKGRGATASQVLSQAGAIIVDFVSTHPLSASPAWEEAPVSRRARVLALYVLCCKMAVKRKIKFDEAVCSEVSLRLLELIEILRAEDFYVPCSFDGLQQDCLVIGLALVLRGTPYAEELLRGGLDRLRALQLDPGLTADGVWRLGSFSDHCALLSQFRTLLADFDRADAALIESIASTAKKMTVFAEAMQKSNGSAPAFDDSGEKSFTRKLSGTRRALAGAGFSKSAPQKNVVPPRITDTYVFRDAQYFVSHSTQKVQPDSSLVVLHADPVSVAQSDPGGVTLVFAYGPTDLLIRTEPPEGTNRRDRAAAFDPALRNGYHIDGVGFAPDSTLKANAARLEKSWRGPGWAAARSIDEINPAGSIARTVLHLKAEHALIVIDELVASTGAQASFEQFWHIAPGLMAPQEGDTPWRFALASGGGMTAAFDALASASVEAEGEGHCVRRTLKMERGVAVALFQWTAEPAPITLEARGSVGDWTVDVSGAGFAGQVQLAGGELRYSPGVV